MLLFYVIEMASLLKPHESASASFRLSSAASSAFIELKSYGLALD